MRPDAEADEAGREHREDDEAIADEFGLRDRRDDHAHHARGGKEDDVDLGMIEEPEEMLPKQRIAAARRVEKGPVRSEEHTSELQSLMRISYAVFCLKKNTKLTRKNTIYIQDKAGYRQH